MAAQLSGRLLGCTASLASATVCEHICVCMRIALALLYQGHCQRALSAQQRQKNLRMGGKTRDIKPAANGPYQG